jgi:pimeloyl-ACP methyl ester carboxylesterase
MPIPQESSRLYRPGWPAWALVAAVGLSAAALYNRHQRRIAERKWPPLGAFLEVSTTRLHYLDVLPEALSPPDQEAAPTIVLLHGNGASIDDFLASGVVARLSRRFRVIVFDRPGYGHSARPKHRLWTAREQARLIGAALSKLNVDRPLVLGHSWGTLVALAMALEQGVRLRGLVLLSGYYFPTIRYDGLVSAGISFPIIGGILRHTVLPLVGRLASATLVAKMFAPRPIAHAFRRFPIELSLRPSQMTASAAEGALMTATAASFQNRYGELHLPVAILAGRDDHLIDQNQQSAKLAAHIPQAELRIMPGLGHMIHYSAMDEIEASIDRLLQPSRTMPAHAKGL